MNRLQLSILLFGALMVFGGVTVLAVAGGIGWSAEEMAAARRNAAYVDLREADEYLRQNSRESARAASVIFNRVLAQNIAPDINDMATYGLAVALEKMDDRQAAIEYIANSRNAASTTLPWPIAWTTPSANFYSTSTTKKRAARS